MSVFQIIWLVLGVLLFFGVLYWKVNRDYKKWLQHIPVRHGKSWRLLCFLLLPSVICMAIASGAWWVWAALAPIPMLAFWWWFLFDGWYNMRRNFKWFFTGSNDVDDAKTDNFLQELTLAQHVTVKLGTIAITTTTYVLTCIYL